MDIVFPSDYTDLLSWFLHQSLPLWNRHGVDRVCGGFYERLNSNLRPTDEPRRARLVARQIYWFASGGSLGWQGPVDELIDHGLRFLVLHLITADAQVRASCADTGEVLDARQHLYDVAFVLVALAKVAQRRPNTAEPEALARRIMMGLTPHPHGGYIDAVTPELQCANPHMHLFEACLAWTRVLGANDGFWFQRAAALANLAKERLIQSQSGALPEHFDQFWRPVRVGGAYCIEPGHQFEWSWLLMCWAAISGDAAAADAASRLCILAEHHGVDHERNVVLECITEHLNPSDHTARLWQQTERLKAWHAQVNVIPFASARRDRALDSLLRFLHGVHPGLWFDEMDSTGALLARPVKASSGYHIACAIEVLLDLFSYS